MLVRGRDDPTEILQMTHLYRVRPWRALSIALRLGWGQLMRKAGVTDYEGFARDILQAIPDRPISFEVFADEFARMARQAPKMATWGKKCSRQNPDHKHAW
jgi:hypothetical protein